MEMLFLQIMFFQRLDLKLRLNKFVNIGPSLRSSTDKLFFLKQWCFYFWQKFVGNNFQENFQRFHFFLRKTKRCRNYDGILIFVICITRTYYWAEQFYLTNYWISTYTVTSYIHYETVTLTFAQGLRFSIGFSK